MIIFAHDDHGQENNLPRKRSDLNPISHHTPWGPSLVHHLDHGLVKDVDISKGWNSDGVVTHATVNLSNE